VYSKEVSSPDRIAGGFHFQFNVGPKVEIIPVASPDDNVLNENVIHDLERALADAKHKPKGVVLCNPHNPLGRCYTRGALEALCKFCEKHDLHLISDEIYALSTYKSMGVPDPTPFISLLSLNLEAIGVSPARTHVIWSVSKDFGCSGIRLVRHLLSNFLRNFLIPSQQGALVTQGNPAMACGVAMAANTQVSCLTAIAVSCLLSEPQTTDKFIELNRERLACAYETMASFLRGLNVRYVPAYAGIFIWAKLSDKVQSWDQEARLTEIVADCGVAVSAGKSYAAQEPGWYRLSFAIEPEMLQEGLRRLAAGIGAFEKHQ
jgi:aspartate/methionine/tyrosine aminotransferase